MIIIYNMQRGGKDHEFILSLWLFNSCLSPSPNPDAPLKASDDGVLEHQRCHTRAADLAQDKAR